MNEDPRFVCKREGHVPSMHFTHSQFVESFICNCKRCGKLATFNADGTEKKPA